MALFVLSFWLHLAGSTQRTNEEALQHHQQIKSMVDMLAEPEFWYESFQNWQSEFLSIGVLLVLGIYLRSADRQSPSPWPRRTPRRGTEEPRGKRWRAKSQLSDITGKLLCCSAATHRDPGRCPLWMWMESDT